MVFECIITDIGEMGDGIARYQEKTVFIPFTAVGDKIKAQAISENSSIIRAEIIEIIEPSPDRQQPPCKHFGKCGGCSLQHLRNDKYIEFKETIISKITKSLACQSFKIKLLFFIGEKSRRRAEFKVSIYKKQLQLGFFAHKTHKVIDIEQCLILEDKILNIIPKLRKCLADLKNTGNIKEINVAVLTNGLDIVIAANTEVSKTDEEKLILFAKENNIVRLGVRLKENSNIKTLFGRKGIVLFDEIEVEFPAGGFLQASQKAEKAITDLILKYTKDNTKICELFCGCGTYTLPLLKQAKKISAYELGEEMVISLFNAARKAELENLLTVNKRDLFKKPLNKEELNIFDCVIINPPRAGAKEQVKQIAQSNVQKVVVVSCNPFTFERDAKELINNGFNFSEITPIDQFYYSSHLELVVLFEK